MKKILIASLILAAFSSHSTFGQILNGDEDISVGVGRTEFLNSSLGTTSLKIDYRSVDGLFVPVSIDLGQDLKSVSAGFGYKTGKELSKIFSYSVAAAINHLRISEDIETIMKEDRNRFTLLFKQEFTFQLTNRLALGINYNVDVLNQGRNHKAKMKTTPESYPLTRYRLNANGTYTLNSYSSYDTSAPQHTPDYATLDEKNAAMDSVKQSSASSFGVSLKIRLGK